MLKQRYAFEQIARKQLLLGLKPHHVSVNLVGLFSPARLLFYTISNRVRVQLAESSYCAATRRPKLK